MLRHIVRRAWANSLARFRPRIPASLRDGACQSHVSVIGDSRKDTARGLWQSWGGLAHTAARYPDILTYRAFSTSIQDGIPLKSALRQFYLKVHPDFFSRHPEQQEENQRSLADLMAFLDDAKESTLRNGVLELVFHLRAVVAETTDEASSDRKSEEDPEALLEKELKSNELGPDAASRAGDAGVGTSSISSAPATQQAERTDARAKSAKTGSVAAGGAGDAPVTSHDIKFQTLKTSITMRATPDDAYEKYVLNLLANLMQRAGIPCASRWSNKTDSLFGRPKHQSRDQQAPHESWGGGHYTERGSRGSGRRRHWRSFVDGNDPDDDISNVSLEEFLSAVASVAQERFLLTRGAVPVSYLDETRLRVRGFKFVFQRQSATTEVDSTSPMHREALTRFRNAVSQSSTLGWVLADDVSQDPRTIDNQKREQPLLIFPEESQFRPNYSTDLAVHKVRDALSNGIGADRSVEQNVLTLLGARSNDSLLSVVIVFSAEGSDCFVDSAGRLVLGLGAPQEKWIGFFENPQLLDQAHDARMQMQKLQQHALAACTEIGFHHIFSEPLLRGHPLYLTFLETLSKPDTKDVLKELFKRQPRLKELSMRIHAPTDGGWAGALRCAGFSVRDVDAASLTAIEVQWPLVSSEFLAQTVGKESADAAESVLLDRLTYDADMGVLLIPADVDTYTLCKFIEENGKLFDT